MESERNNETTDVTSPDTDTGATVAVTVPAGDATLYRYEATDPILHFLVDNPFSSYTIRELSRLTDFSHTAVGNAVEVLTANSLVEVEPSGNRKQVSIDRRRLTKPDDPVLRIPQAEFHEPVRSALDRLREQLDAVKGVLVFGSVARGRADRQSDVDLWVLVQDERGTNQRRANDVASSLESERFDGDRYEYQVLVESVQSAQDVSDRLTEILVSSITLYDTETLRRFKQEALQRGE